MKTVTAILLCFLATVLPAMAEQEIVRFTPDCEFIVTFPGKISTKISKGTAAAPQEWMHVRDIDFLAAHYEISAICRPLDPRGREFELLNFYRDMEKEARQVRIDQPQTFARQDIRHHTVLGQWKGYTRDYAQKPVTVEGRYILGRRSKLQLLVATPGAHPEPSELVTHFFNSVRMK